MGYSENAEKAAQRERDRATSGRGGSSFNTIGGKMEYDRWKASQPKPSSVSFPEPVFPTQRGSSARDISIGGPYPGADPGGLRSTPLIGRRAAQPKVHVPDWTDRLARRIPYWLLGVCAVIGGLIGLAAGASSDGATAVGFAFLGGIIGLVALPLAIKLLQLALRILAVAAAITVFGFILWALFHSAK
jgi:hypothetical protein